MDEDWKFGGDDASITASIRDGRPGTAMMPFKDLITDEQIRQLVFYIREQAGLLKGKPETKVDPHGAIVKSEKQTVKLEVVGKDLETPWGIAFLPDGRMLITERPGRLRILDKGKLLPPVTGTPTVWVRQDGGLFDVEVHPNYAQNGWIYLSFSETLPGYKAPAPDPAAAAPPQGGRGGPPSPPSMTVIVRGKIRDNAWVDQQVIFRGSADLYSPANFHYGSRFIFDREGHLFYSIGDKGNAESAQDLSSPLGKVHRVNDDGSVPKDNPFVGKPGAVGSIWSYGHRNPQGFAFDPVTNKLWETEHGPTGGDELNLIEPGKNYGWAVVSYGMQPGITKSEQEGMVSPKAYWTPTIAPAGIVFYNGSRYPGWKNSLFVGGAGRPAASPHRDHQGRRHAPGSRLQRVRPRPRHHHRTRRISLHGGEPAGTARVRHDSRRHRAHGAAVEPPTTRTTPDRQRHRLLRQGRDGGRMPPLGAS